EEATNTGKAPVRVYALLLRSLQQDVGDNRRDAKIAGHIETLLHGPRFRTSVEARVAAGRFLLHRGELKNARDTILFALKEMPGGDNDPDALLAAAELELAEARSPTTALEHITLARSYLEKAFEIAPKETRVG